MARKRKAKPPRRRAAKPAPTLNDALRAVQARKARGVTDDGHWHLLSSVEGSLRKLGAK